MTTTKEAIKELKKIRKISAEIIKFISVGWKEELQPEVDADKVNTEFQEANPDVDIHDNSVPDAPEDATQTMEQAQERQANEML